MASTTAETGPTMTQSATDGQLLAEAVNGAELRFADLITRHGPMVLAACRRQLGNQADAEDAAQAVFLLLWQQARRLRNRTSVAGWLHHAARNICRNVLRARTVRNEHERKAAKSADDLTVHQRQWDQIKDLLDDELDHLPEKYRLPIVLFHLEGRSLEETAVLLHLKESTVGTRLIRGRERLRQRLQRRGIALSAAGLGTALSQNAVHAALPLFFAEKTARAASLLAAGRLATGELISTHAVALTKGAMQMQSMARLKTVAALGVFLAVIVAGAGIVIAQQRAQDEPPDQRKAIVKKKVNNSGQKELPLKVLWSDNLRAAAAAVRPFGPNITVGRQSKTEKDTLVGPPSAEADSVAMLIGPTHDVSEAWRPTQVLRDGKEITLVIESWRNNFLRDRDAPFRQLFIVSLGRLPAGDYKLNIRINEFRLNVQANAPTKHYRLTQGKVGKLAFAVAPTMKQAVGAMPTLEREQFQIWKGQLPVVDRQRVDDPYYPWAPSKKSWSRPLVHYLDPNAGLGDSFSRLVVGTCDLESQWKKPPTYWPRDMPKLRPPTFGEPVYAYVSGPFLNTGERMQLRSIRWEGRKAILDVALWRDGVERKRNRHRWALLLLPLHEGLARPLSKAGAYEVQVIWTLLYSPDLKDSLYNRYTPKAVAKAPVSPTIKKFFADFAPKSAKFKINLELKPSVKLIDDPNELARMKRYYPHGVNNVDAIRPDGTIIWQSKVIQGNKILTKKWELASVADFKKILSRQKISKQAAFEIYMRRGVGGKVSTSGWPAKAAARAQRILEFLRKNKYKKAGVNSN